MKFVQSTMTAWLLVQQVLATKEHPRKTRNLRARRAKKHHVTSTPRKVSHEAWESRIVGGTNAADGEYSYFVLGDGCGASLVAPDVVLSAAHCRGAFDERVRVGSIFESEGGQLVSTIKSQEVLHPNYNDDTTENDIMLIKLNEEVPFSPVSINFNDNNPVEGSNAVLTVIGFGATSEGGAGSSRLKEVDVNYVDPDRCDEMYGGFGDIKRNIMLCAG